MGEGYQRHWVSANGPKSKPKIQDGLKVPLLCGVCEGLFSKLEKVFSERIFFPYCRDSGLQLVYESWYAKFCASVLWRVLAYMIRTGSLDSEVQEKKDGIASAFRTWRSFLSDEISNPGQHELHVLPFPGIENTSVTDLPSNINRYLLRAIDMDFPTGERSAMVYVKMGSMLMFGFANSPRNKWKGTRISVARGVFEPASYTLPSEMLEYIKDRAKKIADLVGPKHRQVCSIRAIFRFEGGR